MKEYKFRINGNEYNVTINSVEGANASVTVNGKSYQVELENEAAVPVQPVPAVSAVPASAPAAQTVPAPAAPAKPASVGTGKPVTSPLPGVIIAVKVSVGESVKAGQEIAVLEAMKMENSIEATHDGTVTAVHVSKGDSIAEGASIVTIG